MNQDSWQQARLIPTSGITGPDEAERRATSALLAVMGAVREFGNAVVRPLGSPAGALEAFVEVPFKLDDRTVYPDGLLRTSRGGKAWTCLVEVKTGAVELQREQVECYLDVAKSQGFDVVLTISNQLSPAPGVHPVEVSKAKLRKVELRHLSWAEILTVAVQQRVHRGVADPDQAWLLGELIRYLEHPRSGALDFADMGSTWVTVREAVVTGTLRVRDAGLPQVVSRWEQLLRFAALRLGRELGADVQAALSRKEVADPSLRIASQTRSLVDFGVLSGSLRVPDAIAPIDITADLRAGRVTVSADIKAPEDGRSTTRINWLLRQLKDAPTGLRVEAFFAGARASTSELLGMVRENPGTLLDDQKRDIRIFRVAASSALGAKRGTGRGGFIDSILAAIDGFYEAVVQQVRPWSAKAPKLPPTGKTATSEAGIDTTPPERDLVETTDPSLQRPPPSDDSVGVVAEGSEAAENSGPHADPPLQPEVSVVSWESAHLRLERERQYEAAGSESEPV